MLTSRQNIPTIRPSFTVRYGCTVSFKKSKVDYVIMSKSFVESQYVRTYIGKLTRRRNKYNHHTYVRTYIFL